MRGDSTALSTIRAIKARALSGDLSRAPEQIIEVLDGLEELVREAAEKGKATALLEQQFSLNCRYLDERILAIENGLVSRCVRTLGSLFDTSKRKLHDRLRRLAWRRLLQGSRAADRDPDAYRQWVAQEQLSTPSLDWHRGQAGHWPRRCLVSIVLPLRNPVRKWLCETLASVFEQSYEHWELCLFDDASESPWVTELLAEKACEDRRVRIVRSELPIGRAAALNRAGKLTNGEYVAFLGQHDVLSPFALHHVVEALQGQGADLIYTDEDSLEADGRRCLPSFKPDWSPDLLTSCMYIGGLTVIARAHLEAASWFRAEYDSACDYDLLLRLAEKSLRVRHIARVLYHHRVTASVGNSSAQIEDAATARDALKNAVTRRGCAAEVEKGPRAGTYHVRRRVPATRPLVSLIICSRNHRLLRRCLAALSSRTDYSSREVIVVHHASGGDLSMRRVIDKFDCRSIVYSAPFNFSVMNNLAIGETLGEYIVFLNDDVLPLETQWLDYFVGHLQRPEVGAVGAKLLYPSGAIQHAGIVAGTLAGTAHPARGHFGTDYWPWLDLTRNVSAVTGACLGVRKESFQEVGGFEPLLSHDYNDVDLCLRLREAGYWVVYEPRAVLRHDEAQTRAAGIRYEERELFLARWRGVLARSDEFFSPNLTAQGEVGLSFPALRHSEEGDPGGRLSPIDTPVYGRGSLPQRNGRREGARSFPA